MRGSSAVFSRRLLAWYDRCQRDLPWRTSSRRPGPLDPYHVLVSETMLQQTQVATVVPYFNRFIARFATLAELAAADEQEVLRLWQGLGYYSRARNLQSAAKQVVAQHGGTLPSDREALLKLPGIGRYTAGAIASIAFEQRSAILDGNVMRVLCRLDQIETDPRELATRERLWERAEQILPKHRIGDFNSALMELGATVCIPRNPKCLICPVKQHCQALAAGVAERIPAPRQARPTPLERRHTYCIRRKQRWLIEQRPPRGRWAGMWQFVTIEATNVAGESSLPVHIDPPRLLGTVRHTLTHRRYEFSVFIARSSGRQKLSGDANRKWVTLAELDEFPLPRPHVKIAQMLQKDRSIGILPPS